jgi:hypothetical protein
MIMGKILLRNVEGLNIKSMVTMSVFFKLICMLNIISMSISVGFFSGLDRTALVFTENN